MFTYKVFITGSESRSIYRIISRYDAGRGLAPYAIHDMIVSGYSQIAVIAPVCIANPYNKYPAKKGSYIVVSIVVHIRKFWKKKKLMY